MTENFDIVIVGGGLIGVSLALALKDLPIKIAIIEAKPNLADAGSRVLALSLSSKRILQTLNLWQQIMPLATAIKAIHVSHLGRFGATHFNTEEYRIPAFGYVITAQELMQNLMQATTICKNLTIFLAARLTTLSYSNELNVMMLDTPTGLYQLTAKLLVAADGVNSTVRQLKNIAAETTDYAQSAIVTEIQLTRTHQNTAYERFTRDGAIALLPYKENAGTLIWTVAKNKVDYYLKLTDEFFLRELQHYFGYRLGRFLSLGKRNTFPLQKLNVQKSVFPGGALIGNAAHTLHPIAAQGFNLGLRDVAALSQVINDAIAAKQNPGALIELEKYLNWRHTDQIATLNFTHNIVRIFASSIAPLTLLRDLGLFALDILPPAKRIFVQRAMGLNGRLPKLACGINLQPTSKNYRAEKEI